MKFTRNGSTVELYPRKLFPTSIKTEMSWAQLVQEIPGENPYAEWSHDSRVIYYEMTLAFRCTRTELADFVALIDGITEVGDKTITIEGDWIIYKNTDTVSLYVSTFDVDEENKTITLGGFVSL